MNSKLFFGILLVLVGTVLVGCGSGAAKPVEESDCSSCLSENKMEKNNVKAEALVKTAKDGLRLECEGGKCRIVDVAEEGEEKKVKKEGKLKGLFRKIPVISSSDAPQMEGEYLAMAGEEGHYNDIKLPGVAHAPEAPKKSASPFILRRLKSDVWPAGIPLEAEIDPAIMDF